MRPPSCDDGWSRGEQAGLARPVLVSSRACPGGAFRGERGVSTPCLRSESGHGQEAVAPRSPPSGPTSNSTGPHGGRLGVRRTAAVLLLASPQSGEADTAPSNAGDSRRRASNLESPGMPRPAADPVARPALPGPLEIRRWGEARRACRAGAGAPATFPEDSGSRRGSTRGPRLTAASPWAASTQGSRSDASCYESGGARRPASARRSRPGVLDDVIAATRRPSRPHLDVPVRTPLRPTARGDGRHDGSNHLEQRRR